MQEGPADFLVSVVPNDPASVPLLGLDLIS